jgi:hypothetical protein
MYMGHYAIALGARRALRPVPLPCLLVAAVAPDLYDAIASIAGLGGSAHALPGVGGVALAAALVTALWSRRAVLAVGVAALVISHVATDYVTSRMPVWAGGPTIGLGIYAVWWLDLAVESLVIVVGLLLYARADDLRRPVRNTVVAMAAVMLGAQVAWDVLLAQG